MRSASARRASGSEVVPDLVTVGGLTVDNVVAADGRVALAQAGGNGAYSAVGALLWTERVGLVSAAVESYPSETLARLRAGGVDLSGVVWVPERLTACSWFIYDDRGDRDEGLTSPPGALAEAGFPTDRLTPEQTAGWRAALGARPPEVGYSEFRDRHPLMAEQVPETWVQTRGVHLAPSRPEVMQAMLDRFGTGPVITADPGWQLAALPLDAIAPILARLDAFLPSEVEVRALVPGAGLGEALAVLGRLTPGAVAVKLGPRGVLVLDRSTGAPVAVPAQVVPTVDPTGAGDAFSGGFLAGLVETRDPVAAARFGAMSAAQTVASFGADGALPADRAGARSRLGAEEPAWL